MCFTLLWASVIISSLFSFVIIKILSSLIESFQSSEEISNTAFRLISMNRGLVERWRIRRLLCATVVLPLLRTVLYISVHSTLCLSQFRKKCTANRLSVYQCSPSSLRNVLHAVSMLWFTPTESSALRYRHRPSRASARIFVPINRQETWVAIGCFNSIDTI